MKAKRLLLALVMALLISGLFTFWLSRRMGAPARAVAPHKQLYVAAARSLQADQALTAADLQLIEWPASAPLSGSFTRIEDVAGRVVLYPLPKGEPILERQLALAGSGAGLTAAIPAGMRAIAVRSDEVVGVAGFLLPGTHVDVLLTYHAPNRTEPQTLTVLQNVVVLAAGQQNHPDPDGKPISVNVVTLLLQLKDAEKLVLASSLGPIHFVLRNGADQERALNPPVGLNQLAGASAPLHRASARHPALRSNHQPYQVETILGDKLVVSNFH